jgi:enoyl-CoA hydratase
LAGIVKSDRLENGLILTFENVGKRNSLDLPMLEQLRVAASTAAADAALRWVILRGAGDKAFCAGADFDAITVPPLLDTISKMDQALEAAVTALGEIEVPVVAAINGACFGGGLQLALAADIRLCNRASRFGIPAAQLGMAYPLAAIARITDLCGPGMAKLLLLTGENFDADSALQRRLVDEVVEPDQFEDRLQQIAFLIESCPSASVKAYKRMVDQLDRQNSSAARDAHLHFAQEHVFLPKLEAIVAERKARRGKVGNDLIE